MINPNRNTSEEVLWRLKEASNERMRVELMCSIEQLKNEFEITWDDIGRLLEMKKVNPVGKHRADIIKQKIIAGTLTLNDLNTIAHLFSTEPYIIFRPREPWTRT